MAERLEVPARGPVAPGADGSDVVDKLGECGPADAPTLPAPRLAPEHWISQAKWTQVYGLQGLFIVRERQVAQ